MRKESTKLVRVDLEEAMNYRMTPEQHARFAAIRDEDINYSDIQDQGDFTDWTRPDALASLGSKQLAPHVTGELSGTSKIRRTS